MRRRALVVIGITAAVGAAVAVASAGGDRIASDCTFRGKKLYGRVKVVEHFEDFRVKVVDHFPDLKVKFVDHFPDSCGRWQLVDDFPDFTIRYVTDFPDFEIEREDSFPGLP